MIDVEMNGGETDMLLKSCSKTCLLYHKVILCYNSLVRSSRAMCVHIGTVYGKEHWKNVMKSLVIIALVRG